MTDAGAVVFTDLVGFTAYNDAAGDAAAVEVLDQQLDLARQALDGRAGARIVKELGDGLIWWIPDPDDALAAAVAFLADVDGVRRIGGFPLAVRAGVHHGEVTSRRDDLVGHTVNVASRIADLAGPGELLISEATLTAARHPTPTGYDPIGPATVKGVATPIWLYRAALGSGE